MKKCLNCGYETEEDLNFCPECGQKLSESKTDDGVRNSDATNEIKTCPRCGKAIDNDEALYCSSCGAFLNQESGTSSSDLNQDKSFISSVKSDLKNSETINHMGSVVSSVKNDINNSETINQVKTKVSTLTWWQKRNITIAAVVLLAVIILAVIISNIHTCDECGDVYFGSKNEISFFGETEDICDDCYNDLFGYDF